MNTHAETRKNIFLLGETTRRSLFFFFFYLLSFLKTNHNRLTQGMIFISYIHYPITFLHFFCLPSRLSPISYSFSFFLYFRQRLVSQLSCSSCGRSPSHLLSFMSAFAIIFVFEIKLSYFSVSTHTCTLCHAPAEEFTSHPLSHSPLCSTDPRLSPLLLLLLALSVPLVLSSLL